MVLKLFALSLISIASIPLFAQSSKTDKTPKDIEVVVHRGANDLAPENTVASADSALAHGAKWIEVDVRPSKDGVMYNLHDDTLDRTTNGKGNISDWLAKDIEKLDAGNWYDKKFRGIKVPTIEAMIDSLDGKAFIYFDVKPGANVKDLIGLVRKKNFVSRSFFWFAKEDMLREFVALAPEMTVKVNAADIARLEYWKTACKPSIVEVNADRITPEFLEYCHENKIKVMVGAQGESIDDYRKAIETGADMINLDKPELFEKLYSNRRTPDGPYLIYDSLGTGVRVINVDTNGNVVSRYMDYIPGNQTFKVTTSDARHTFDVPLHFVQQPQWDYAMPSRLFVTSDPHANFECLFSLLTENGVINENCEWTYGDGQFVMIGDVMDRGVDVLPIYWLLYKLEAEAAKAGGAVHFLLGNHEPLVLMNDIRYTEKKYKDLAAVLGMSCGEMFASNTELGRWIATRNTIERIGRNIFVHAGLGKEFYDTNLSIPEVNSMVPAGLYKRKKERMASGDNIAFLHATYGPIWYRGLVRKEEKYHPIASDSLNLILNRFSADRIIVGHTIHDEISSFYDGRVIGVNVDNSENREANRTRALLIENGKTYVVRNNGIREEFR